MLKLTLVSGESDVPLYVRPDAVAVVFERTPNPNAGLRANSEMWTSSGQAYLLLETADQVRLMVEKQ